MDLPGGISSPVVITWRPKDSTICDKPCLLQLFKKTLDDGNVTVRHIIVSVHPHTELLF